MHEDGSDRVRLLVRLEVEQVIRHGPPHARSLVRFAGVGGDDVLEDRLDGLRNLGFGDGDEVVIHGFCSCGAPRLSLFHHGGKLDLRETLVLAISRIYHTWVLYNDLVRCPRSGDTTYGP